MPKSEVWDPDDPLLSSDIAAHEIAGLWRMRASGLSGPDIANMLGLTTVKMSMELLRGVNAMALAKSRNQPIHGGR